MIYSMNMLDQMDDGEIWPPIEPSPTEEETLKMKKEKEKYLEKVKFPFCSPESNYRKIIKVGHGTYGYEYNLVFLNFFHF